MGDRPIPSARGPSVQPPQAVHLTLQAGGDFQAGVIHSRVANGRGSQPAGCRSTALPAPTQTRLGPPCSDAEPRPEAFYPPPGAHTRTRGGGAAVAGSSGLIHADPIGRWGGFPRLLALGFGPTCRSFFTYWAGRAGRWPSWHGWAVLVPGLACLVALRFGSAQPVPLPVRTSAIGNPCKRSNGP